jgi:hypothetical protein
MSWKYIYSEILKEILLYLSNIIPAYFGFAHNS